MPCRSAQLWLRWGIRILACAAPSELSRKVWVSGSTRQLPRAIQHAVRFVAVPVVYLRDFMKSGFRGLKFHEISFQLKFQTVTPHTPKPSLKPVAETAVRVQDGRCPRMLATQN